MKSASKQKLSRGTIVIGLCTLLNLTSRAKNWISAQNLEKRHPPPTPPTFRYFSTPDNARRLKLGGMVGWGKTYDVLMFGPNPAATSEAISTY